MVPGAARRSGSAAGWAGLDGGLDTGLDGDAGFAGFVAAAAGLAADGFAADGFAAAGLVAAGFAAADVVESALGGSTGSPESAGRSAAAEGFAGCRSVGLSESAVAGLSVPRRGSRSEWASVGADSASPPVS
jgi:hypothetical protein